MIYEVNLNSFKVTPIISLEICSLQITFIQMLFLLRLQAVLGRWAPICRWETETPKLRFAQGHAGGKWCRSNTSWASWCHILVSQQCCMIAGFHLIAISRLIFSLVQSLSRVQLFATPWITARQASLSTTNSRSSLRLTSIESVMPSSHRWL